MKRTARLSLITILVSLIFLEILQISEEVRKIQFTRENFWGKNIEERHTALQGPLYLLVKAYQKQLPPGSRVRLVIDKSMGEIMALDMEKIFSYYLCPLDARDINQEGSVDYLISIVYDREKGAYYSHLRNSGNASRSD